jgi:hypothetical protein
MTISCAQEFIEQPNKFTTLSAIRGYIQTYRRSGIRYNFLYDVLIAIGYMLLFTDLQYKNLKAQRVTVIKGQSFSVNRLQGQ